MQPVEIIFLVIIALFGIVGIVRGYNRELGVTTMLLLALFVLQLIVERYDTQFDSILAFVAGTDPSALSQVRGLVFCAFLLIIAFVSYQGETLSFPSRGSNMLFSGLSGLLNGYLFAGSIWYYLHAAGWPLFSVTEPFSNFYEQAIRVLPPAIFRWPYLVALAVFMLIARVWK